MCIYIRTQIILFTLDPLLIFRFEKRRMYCPHRVLFFYKKKKELSATFCSSRQILPWRYLFTPRARRKDFAVKRIRGEKEIFMARACVCVCVCVKATPGSSIISYLFVAVRQTNRENLNPLLRGAGGGRLIVISRAVFRRVFLLKCILPYLVLAVAN